MKDRFLQIRNAVFYLLIVVFAILVIWFANNGRYWVLNRLPYSVIAYLAIAFIVLGVALVVLTVLLKETRIQKVFFVLMGISAASMPICAKLHKFVYTLFIGWYGQGFWQRHNMPDEPIFLILTIIVFPILFLTGTIGSIVLLIKKRIAK
ncbi:MAG: hypothetical protein ACE14V_15330 [bacterium]